MVGAREPRGAALGATVADARGAAGAGVTLVAPWDGHGMTATQSHALAFADYPAVRLA